MNESSHVRYMRRAIELAGNVPDLPFGAVIVDQPSGEIVAEGWNRGSVNPTWHGEIDAINNLVANRGADFSGAQLALYSTAEPCPMCMGAIAWCNLGAVSYGVSIDYLKQKGFLQILIGSQEIVDRTPGWTCRVQGGLLLQDCEALFGNAGLGS